MKSNYYRFRCLAIVLLISPPALIYGQCTEFYGVNSMGGHDYAGSFFKTDGDGNNMQTVYNLRNRYEQYGLCDKLCEADNGKLYGMASNGGSNGDGIIFEWDPVTNVYTTKITFNGDENGVLPRGSLIKASNGNLYGITREGGTNRMGVLFEYNTLTNEITKKLDFNGLETGSYPEGSLIRANNGKFYGMTHQGGVQNKGVLYEWDDVSNSIKKKFDFDGNRGTAPLGSLVQADNGKLYGMTPFGGILDKGVIFAFDPASDSLVKLLDFTGANGQYPYGSLMQADNGKLYGVTAYGGNDNSEGVLFELDPVNNNYNKIMDFSRFVTGSCPAGSLIQANNGQLYGTVTEGGVNDKGGIFEWNLTSDTYTLKVQDDVRGTLIQTGNGKLYGMTNVGSYKGSIFEWDPVTNVFLKKFQFFRVNDGLYPMGSFVQASNGKLYGMSYYGPVVSSTDLGSGVIFEWDPGASNFTQRFIFNGENGSHPTGSLIQAKNGKLYGMTPNGGTNDSGVLFEFDPKTGVYIKKLDFNGLENGKRPCGSLLEANNGKLYGMTSSGGTFNMGVIFEWDPVNDIFTKKLDFNGKANGRSPVGSLIQARNNKVYGMTDEGGIYGYNGSSHGGFINGYGVLFEWDPATNEYNKKFDFTAESGNSPIGSLAESDNGKLYGATLGGGATNGGTLFEYDPYSEEFSKKLDFKDTITGCNPFGSLLAAKNGKLYGMTFSGGNWNGGVLFEYDPLTENYAIKFRGVTAYYTVEKTLIEISKNTRSTDIQSCNSYVSPSGKYIWTTSGTYTDTIHNGIGCDSIIHIELTVTHPSESSVELTACQSFISPSGRYTWNESGTYLDTIPNAGGCDSLITIHLIVNQSTESTLNEWACDSYISSDGKHTLKESGSYIDTIPNAAGCDSMITVNVTVLKSDSSILGETACESYYFNKKALTSSGTYYDTIPNAMGCDSVIILNLVIERTVSSIYPVVCNNYTSPSGKYSWESSGTYVDIIPNAAGCDSVITIDLQVDHVDTSVIQDRSVLISNDRNADHQWIDCDNGNVPIPGETWLTYTARKNGRYAVIVSNGTCVDTSGIYEILLTGINEPGEDQITLYPNPTFGNFTIDLSKVFTEALLTITRYDGQIIRKEKILSKQFIQLNLDAPPGVYMVNITAESEEYEFKLVKK